jgi:multisite-specific tRNA:(cytosine-C5)-methyltransferase
MMENSIRIYPHLQDTGGFFIAVLRHRQSVTASKYYSRLFQPASSHFFGTREGKRIAEEVSETPDTKKARRDSDEDTLMASAFEFPTPKRSAYIIQISHWH